MKHERFVECAAMKVIELRDDWSLENVVPGTRPDPKPGPGQIVVKMEAASLNYRDFVMVRRGYGRHTGALPLIVLSDGAGRVIETGKDVTRVGVGDLVCPLFAQPGSAAPSPKRTARTCSRGRSTGSCRNICASPRKRW